MKFKKFSKKQLLTLNWWCEGSEYRDCDAVICDGAVRSGKTVCMSLSFVLWSFYRFNGGSFALCGKTVTSLRRNLVAPLISALTGLGFVCELKLSQNLLVIKQGGRQNRFYLFGGRDESSGALIQGITLCGVLLDEVALMPRSFVEQALARCSVDGSKFWFNCNPEHPGHWFYREWIQKAADKKALYIHFEMGDNPSLTRDILERYKALYSDVFYRRFVQGQWVAAQGAVYAMFDEQRHTCSTEHLECSEFYISCDYGTVNPASFGLWGCSGGVWYRLGEYYYSSRDKGAQLTDEEYYEALEQLAGERKITAVIIDPSASSFITLIRRKGRFRVIPAKNEVLNGIRRVCDALKSGRIKIGRGCADAIREFGLYVWEEGNAGAKESPKKENDHAMDDIRYFVCTALEQQDDFFALAL